MGKVWNWDKNHAPSDDCLVGKDTMFVRLGVYHPDLRAKLGARWTTMESLLALRNMPYPSITPEEARRGVDEWFEECERHVWVSTDYSEPSWLKGIRE